MIVATDLEGVLVPEIWPEIARATGVVGLAATTHEEPDFARLTERRIRLLDQHDLRLPALLAVVEELSAFPGAAELLAWARTIASVVVVSDVFQELAAPLVRSLGSPALFANALQVDREGRIRGSRMRIAGRKDRVIRPLREIGFRIVAIGDGHNDESMLRAADHAVLFRAGEALAERLPGAQRASTYEEVRGILAGVRERIAQDEHETV